LYKITAQALYAINRIFRIKPAIYEKGKKIYTPGYARIAAAGTQLNHCYGQSDRGSCAIFFADIGVRKNVMVALTYDYKLP
jgi:hypothetical protein